MKRNIVVLTLILALLFPSSLLAIAPQTDEVQPYALMLKEAIYLTLKNSPDLQKDDVMVGLVERGKIDSKNLYRNVDTGVRGGIGNLKQQLKATEAKQAYLVAQTGGDPDLLHLLTPDLAALEVQKQAITYSLSGLDILKDARDDIEDVKEGFEDGYDDALRIRKDADKKISFGVEKLYLSMLSLQDFIVVQKDNVSLQQRLREIEEIKYQNGLSTAVDVAKASQKVRDEEERLNDLKNTYVLLTYQMNRNIGREWDAPLVLAPTVFDPVEIGDIEEVYEKALEASLEVEQYNRTIHDKEHDIIKNKRHSDVVNKIKLQIQDTELKLEQTKYNIQNTLEGLRYQYRNAQKMVVNKTNKYGTTKVEYEQAKVLCKQEMGLQVQLEGSELLMKKAKSEYLKALYDYYLATRELQIAQDGIFLAEVKA
ncbi:MAG: TolC family protein [Clostridia bacterium]|nr:TolC family protein [Clostridia bacterium]